MDPMDSLVRRPDLAVVLPRDGKPQHVERGLVRVAAALTTDGAAAEMLADQVDAVLDPGVVRVVPIQDVRRRLPVVLHPVAALRDVIRTAAEEEVVLLD